MKNHFVKAKGKIIVTFKSLNCIHSGTVRVNPLGKYIINISPVDGIIIPDAGQIRLVTYQTERPKEFEGKDLSDRELNLLVNRIKISI